MTTLWLKFPDEVLSSHCFSRDDQQKLDAVFSTDNSSSPWRQALTLLSLKGSPEPILKWVSGCPYFNWTEMTRLTSGGAMIPVKTPDGRYAFKTSYAIRSLAGLLMAQWKIARFLNRPMKHDGSLSESLALGIVLQSLIMRAGGDTEKIATALASRSETSKNRQVLEQIQMVQMRRTAISHVWQDVLPKDMSDHTAYLPDFFWDNEIPLSNTMTPDPVYQDNWKGMAVCAGKITGLAVVIGRHDTPESLQALKSQYNAPLVLVFRQARPQTVELFPYADALLFAEGGILSHACTVAREMNIPAVTGLGGSFYVQIEKEEKIWLTLDGSTGTVSKIA